MPAEENRGWEPVIGMEVHAQLATRSKMFCACSTDATTAEPNANTCEVCLGLPGVLPVPNRLAVEQVVKTALALGCEVARHTKFDRKNYFYPDLPKGYQISQYDLPISRHGRIEVEGREVRITRVHLEEDTGSLKHAGDALQSAQESLVDLNRSGTPLMEIVTEPDLHSAEEAREYATELRAILRAVGASEADMEKGQLRAEANVSVRRSGTSELGVKTELKNINSFRALQRAVAYEIERQVGLLEAGREVVQETRGWSEPEQRTYSQRSKEFAQDYRYFPEPDIPPLELDPAWVESLRAALPELPNACRRRLQERHGLGEYDARLLVEAEAGGYFEAAVAAGAPSKQAANWIIGERPTLPAAQLAELIDLVGRGAINREQAKAVMAESQATGRPPAAVVEQRGLAQVGDEDQLGPIVDRVLAENPQAVADYTAGKQQAIGALLAGVKAATAGKADMKVASELLRRRLTR